MEQTIVQGLPRQIVDIPAPRGGQDLPSSASSSGLPGTANHLVFRTFPRGKKKCALGLALGVRTASRVEPIHAGGSAGGFLHGCSWGVDAFSQWQVETSGLGPRSLAAGVKVGRVPCHASAYDFFWKNFFVFPVLCARAVRTWNLVHYFFVSLLLAVLVPGVWVLLCVRKLDSSGDDFTSWVQCLVQQWIHVLRQFYGGFGRMYTFSTWRRTRFLKRCFSIRFEWRSVPSRCFSCSLALRGSHFETHEFHGLSCMIRDRIFCGTCVSHRCRWCRSRRVFYSQVTRHPDCQLDRSVVST